MANGKVKWFNNAKGYGFVLPDDGGEDLFAHFSSIEMEGYKTLKAGQPVIFDVLEGPKGQHAVNIRIDGEILADSDNSTEHPGVDVDLDIGTTANEEAAEPDMAAAGLRHSDGRSG